MPVLTYRATGTGNASSASVTVVKPVGLALGDLMIAEIRRGGNNTNPTTVPSGWTLVSKDNSAAAAYGTWIYWKIAVAADVSATNFVWVFATAVGSGGRIHALYGAYDATTPIQGISAWTGVTASGTTINIPTYSTTRANTTVLLLTAIYSGTTGKTHAVPTSPTYSEKYDAGSTLSGLWTAMAMYEYPTSGTATGTLAYPCNAVATYRVGLALAINQAVNTITSTVVDALGGTISPGPISVAYGGTQAFTMTPDANWHIEYVTVDGGSVSATSPYTFTNVIAPHSIDVTFALDVHTVTFDAQSGSPSGTQLANYGYPCSTRTDPTRSGYAFGGWWTGTNGSGTQFYPGTTIVYDNLTVYAKWTASTYTVTFDSQGGSAVSPVTGITPGTFLGGSMPTNPTKTGATFQGWYTGTNGTGTGFANGTAVNASITVYAYWTALTFSLGYNAGANGSITGTTAQYGVAYGTNGTQVTAVPDTNYHFVNWTGYATTTANPLTDTNVTQNRSYLANFAMDSLAPTVALNTADAAGVSTSTPTLAFTGTDLNGDAIEYEIQIDTVNTFDSQV